MKVNFELKKQKLKNGESPLYMKFSHLGKRCYIRIGDINEEDWDNEKENIKENRKGMKLQDIKNKIDDLGNKAFNIHLEYFNEKRFLSSEMLRSLVLDENNKDFISLSEDWIATRVEDEEITYRTSVKYKSILKKLRKFCENQSGQEILPLKNFNKSFIREFTSYMKNELGNHTNTITSNLKCLKAITFYLMGQDHIKHNDNPFNGLKMKHEKPKRKVLTLEEIIKIQELELNDVLLKKVKRIFLFLYETGLRINEALQIEISDVETESLVHILSKQNKGNTKEKVELFYTDNAKKIVGELLEEAKDNQFFLFKFLSKSKHTSESKLLSDLSSVTAIINDNLKIIAAKAKVNKPISTHYGRHSLATIALTYGSSYEELKTILNHKQISTTEHYAKPTDEAKRRATQKLNANRMLIIEEKVAK